MRRLIALALGAAFVALGTVGALATDACAGRKPYTIIFATHAFDHPFFPILEAGAQRGSADACLDYAWTEDVAFSVDTTIERIDEAVAENPDILVVSVVDAQAMRPALDRAAAAGIPIIAINVPDLSPSGERVPYLIYIGSDESQGGVAAADQILARMMPARAACINKLPDHAAVNVRCAGWTETMKAAGVPVDLVDVSGGPAKAEATLSAYLRSHPDTDAFLTATSGANDYGLTLAALSETGMRGGEAALVTFDLTPKVLDSIKAGDTLAAIDQQPYLQGYLSAVLARQYLDAGLMPVGDILTGPSVVNADNIDQVLAGTALGRR